LSAIARVAKNPPIELVAAIEEPAPAGRIASEFAALGLWAIAAYAVLSLLCADAGWSPNLGGPIGASLARWLGYLLGLQAYLAIALAALLGRRLWRHRGEPANVTALRLAREIGGGMIMLAGVCTAVALCDPDGRRGGLIGGLLAAQLRAYLNLGGGAIVVMLALAGGTVLMAGRAPTELVSSVWRTLRRHPEPAPDTDSAFDGSGLAPEAASASIPLVTRPQAETPIVRLGEPARSYTHAATPPPRPPINGDYKIPPLTLLDVPPLEHDQVDEGQLERSARMLELKLADFGVEGKVVEVQPGPVVSMYKLEPGSGIKVSQIVNLADDLSMALRAATIRIQAPVPGEAVVGIEVPNRKREKIFLREILEAEQFAASSSRLMIALGKDIAGRPMAADLAAMPHLLIAGATGTGKSVSIHTMIASILFNATPDDVRFILIDPKMLELSVYDAIPHLLVPVVVDPEKAAAALLWATREMEGRYRMMRDLGVRNIDSYNQALGESGELIQLRTGGPAAVTTAAGDDEEVIRHRRLPKIVIVIDELADLLLSEGKTVERDITRLAQKARASGIHLILATQRPSVDVLTGLIKANLPARISLQVTSRVDSRTILDSIGAERLLGAGDMLFMPPGTAKLRRLHGPFVSENEIRDVCDFIRAQGSPDYQMEILETAVAGENEGEAGGERDPLYDEAVRLVTDSGQASISMIQRRLRIGYNRAARMVEEMERDGLVLPADGARPRELRIRAS
jgi:DNA segregation ATPase FtsK/SpoIIIE, S-DNA-T family